MPAPTLRVRIGEERNAVFNARNEVPRAACFICGPLQVAATAIATPGIMVVPSALPCITHENNSASSVVESLLDDSGRHAHAFSQATSCLRHACRIPSFR